MMYHGGSQDIIILMGTLAVTPLEMLRNLMVMATADGRLADEELELLNSRRELWGISRDDFAEALEYAQSASGQLTFPSEEHARHDLMYDLLAMMSADGHFDDMELNLFALVAARLEIPASDLDRMLDEFNQDDDLLLGGD